MPAIIFLSTLAAYLYTLAPSITVGDSGEFCAASVILGLPHSPGYPLYCLLGKIFTLIIPYGSYAFRINIMSAVVASLCVALLYAMLLKLSNSDTDDTKVINLAALFSVLLFAISSAFWHSAIQSEVFGLNALFAVLVLFSFINEKYYLASFLFGLGLGNHHTLIFLGPLFLVALKQNRAISLKFILQSTILFVIGFSIYLYLPIRSFKNPALDWGNPETFNNFWRVISRADYGSLSLTVGEKIPRNLTMTLEQVLRFFKVLIGQFSYVGVLLGLLGCFVALKKNYKFAKSLLFLFLLAGPGFLLLSNMPFDSQSDGILERFYIIVNVFWAFPLLWGLEFILKEVYSRIGLEQMGGFLGSADKKFVYLTGFLLFIGSGLLAVKVFPSVNWRDYYLSYDYGRNILKTLQPNSVFFMDGGDDTFYSMAYLCFAQKKRQDIELHDRGGLVFSNIYGKDFRNLSKEEKEIRRNKIEKGYFLSRNIFYSTFNKDVLPGVKLTADGILYRPLIAPPKFKFVTAEPVALNSWQMYSLRSVYAVKYYDYRSNALAPVYTYFAAYHNTDRLLFWEYTYNRWPYVLWLGGNIKYELMNYAFQRFENNYLEEAEQAYKRIIKLFPSEVSALVNLGVIAEKQNSTEKSKNYYKTALAIDPRYADAYYNLSVLYWKEENWSEVVKNLKLLLANKPDDQRAKYYLPLAISKLNR